LADTMQDDEVYWPETQALQVVQEAASDVVEYVLPVRQGVHTVFEVFLQAVPM
jgi:hypothetical protein